MPSLTTSIFSGQGGQSVVPWPESVHEALDSVERHAMPKRFSNVPEHLREPHQRRVVGPPAVIYWKAFGVTIALGFVTGLVWIAWRLFDLHVLDEEAGCGRSRRRHQPEDD